MHGVDERTAPAVEGHDVVAGRQGGADPHHLVRPVDLPLGQGQEVRRDERDALGQRVGELVELLGRHRVVGQAVLLGLLAGQRVAGEDHLLGLAHRQVPREPAVVGRGHVAHRRVADERVVGDDEQVAVGGQLAATGQAVAVGLGDDHLGEVPDQEVAGVEVARPLRRAGHDRTDVGQVLGADAAAEVVAGAEAPAVALDDDHGHVGVALGDAQGVEELAAQRVAEGVHPLRPVQRDPGHRRGDLVEDVLVVERLPVVRVIGRHRPCLVRRAEGVARPARVVRTARRRLARAAASGRVARSIGMLRPNRRRAVVPVLVACGHARAHGSGDVRRRTTRRGWRRSGPACSADSSSPRARACCCPAPTPSSASGSSRRPPPSRDRTACTST